MRRATQVPKPRLTPGPFRSSVRPPHGRGADIERMGVLDETNAERIVSDAIWVGRGASLELRLAPAVARHNVTWLRGLAVRLARYGVSVSVSLDRREEGLYAAEPY